MLRSCKGNRERQAKDTMPYRQCVAPCIALGNTTCHASCAFPCLMWMDAWSLLQSTRRQKWHRRPPLQPIGCDCHAPYPSHPPLPAAQNDLPLMCDWDKQCIQALGSEFEIDFINISYCRTAEDVREAHRCMGWTGLGAWVEVA